MMSKIITTILLILLQNQMSFSTNTPKSVIEKLLRCQHKTVAQIVEVVKSNNINIEYFHFQDGRPFIVEGMWFQTKDSIFVLVKFKSRVVLPVNLYSDNPLETSSVQKVKIKKVSIVINNRKYFRVGFLNFSRRYKPFH